MSRARNRSPFDGFAILWRSGGRAVGIAGAFALSAVGVAIVAASCQSPPTPVPLRTFERPQKVASVCLAVNDAMGNQLPLPIPEPLNACPPVPVGGNGATMANHLFALVTQQTRGQLAVVDLTQGRVVDEDRSTPGNNFIPVGADPTDVAVSPDAALAFVASAAPNALAIYGIDSSRLLGDSTGDAGAGAVPLTLTDLRACSLPQPPRALAILPLAPPDGGTGPAYAIVALLSAVPGSPAMPAQVVVLDPTPLSAGAPTSSMPGILGPCVELGTTTLASTAPTAWVAGTAWPDGVAYADAGDFGTPPALGAACAVGVSDASAPDAGTGDASGDDGGAGVDATPDAPSVGPGLDAGNVIAPGVQPRPMSMAARDDAPVVYVGDNALPLIHVISLGAGGAPQEIGQYYATSLVNPSRQVAVGALALSPVTRDLRRYLYAVDADDGTIIVFDATSPTPPSPPQTPLLRPHAELNPFAPIDRIAFSAPVASMAFVQHDWPLVPPAPNTNVTNAYTGLLCDPNPNALALADGGGVGFVDGGIGGYYRADFAQVIQPQGVGATGFPSRLRGVFAFATLSNGNVVIVDVDDWDAPCRRPDPMQVDGGNKLVGQIGQLDVPEPAPSGPGDLDPYHAPTTTLPSYRVTGVTEETFFPVSAPNRIRSAFLLRNDPSSGNHIANVVSTPQVFDSNGSPLASGGGSPIILPTKLAAGFIDPTYLTNATAADPSTVTSMTPALENSVDQGRNTSVLEPSSTSIPGVRLSFDDPTAAIDQDWTVTYEGVLPTANGLVANLSSSDGYETLTLAPSSGPAGPAVSNGAQFCSRGIEDWNVGRERAGEVATEMTAAGFASPADRGSWTADYVEVVDDLLPQGDPYWSESPDGSLDCWDNPGAPGLTADAGVDGSVPASTADARYQACFQYFGLASNADATYARDFPILNATDNALELGRFGWPSGTPEKIANRVVVSGDPGNAPFLKFLTCCFHRQIGFNVRAGGEWLATGNTGLGLLHHVVKDPLTSACVVRCDEPREALLNARAFELPRCDPLGGAAVPSNLLIDRDSALAMRNPMFSFAMWSACGALGTGNHELTARDVQWRFSTRGGFTPISISLAGSTTATVSPESMLYIAPIQQLAVVDGSLQGLVTIDVNTLKFAHDPYF